MPARHLPLLVVLLIAALPVLEPPRHLRAQLPVGGSDEPDRVVVLETAPVP